MGRTNTVIKSGSGQCPSIVPMVLQFANATDTNEVDLSNVDFSKLTTLNNLFTGAKSSKITAKNKTITMASIATSANYAPFNNCTATSIDLSGWHCPNTTNFAYMFLQAKVTNIILDNFDTSAATNMLQMFNNLPNLASLDLSSFDTSNVTTMQYMFNFCVALTSLDISSFTTEALTDASNMFRNCSSLQYLDMRNFTFSNITNTSEMFGNEMPANCEIIVKDTTEKTWINTNFPRFTNVKTVNEL